MAFGTITFTDPVFNKDYSRSLTPPDNPIEYTKKTPSPGNVFIYNTQTGARAEISIQALGPYFGFDVDGSGNSIATPIPAPAIPVQYYTIVENQKSRNAGYSLSKLIDAFNYSGFYTSSLRAHSGSTTLLEFDVAYLTPEELLLVKDGEFEYIQLGVGWESATQPITQVVETSLPKPASVTTTAPPGIPGSPTALIASGSATPATTGGLWSMNIMGIPLVYVGGGLIGLLFLLRR